MPTTLVGDYTLVPKPADFAVFLDANVTLLANLFGAGVQVFDAIADTCRGDFQKALYGTQKPNVVVLVEEGGSTLELHRPQGRPPVLATFPSEHLSHAAWQARTRFQPARSCKHHRSASLLLAL